MAPPFVSATARTLAPAPPSPSPSLSWSPADPAASLRALISQVGDLPLPGAGRTLQRWRVLADVAALDVAAIKLYEGHADAVAILAELDPQGRIDRMARAQVDGATGYVESLRDFCLADDDLRSATTGRSPAP